MWINAESLSLCLSGNLLIYLSLFSFGKSSNTLKLFFNPSIGFVTISLTPTRGLATNPNKPFPIPLITPAPPFFYISLYGVSTTPITPPNTPLPTENSPLPKPSITLVDFFYSFLSFLWSSSNTDDKPSPIVRVITATEFEAPCIVFLTKLPVPYANPKLACIGPSIVP